MRRIFTIIAVGIWVLNLGYWGFPRLFEYAMSQGNGKTVEWKLPPPHFPEWIEGPIPNRPLHESRLQFACVPEVTRDRNSLNIVLKLPSGSNVHTYCYGSKELSALIGTKSELAFTVWVERRVSRHTPGGREDVYNIYEIESVTENGKVLYDASVCRRHALKMERAIIDIHYGLPMASFMDALSKDFPDGPGFVLGGCCVGSETKAFGYKCTKCVAAYQLWCEQQSRSKPSEPISPSEHVAL